MWGVFLNLFYCLCRLCSSNSLEMERNEPIHSEDLNSGASSSLTSPVGDCEAGTKKMERNDYEVFLSFRGKDTRKGFTDYLYTSLVDVGIHVFRDDNELCVGEEIGQELLHSITQSKISIPIISEDYASSKWCLCELALMLNCKRDKGQMVLPIFYKVEPRQVEHLTGKFGDAINTHKKNLEEHIVKEWEEALKEVTSLKGLESEKIDNGREGTLVKIVVGKVMSKLKELFLLNVPKQLVGIDDHVEHIMRFIDAPFSDTSIIGIYGMGGIGKTTLAKVLYNKLWSHYESRSFVANIQEKIKFKGLEGILKQLISDITGGLCDVSNVDHGIGILKSRCTSKKVLILLDDMDYNTHLNALVEDNGWFKTGSIVIITTRDKSILDKARVRHMYQLDELPLDQSLVLFSRHAFRMDSPPSDYGVISRDIVSTTGGLPLALEVIGSFLCGKTKDAWKATSKKLEKVPDTIVQEKLRISYDALDSEDQQIFLDIACFFIGSPKQNPTYMWDACGFFPGKGIEVLNLMSLIKISDDGKLMMHDQLRDLGREIIRQENLKKPQKRSRLWEYEDGVDVLLSNKGTSKIEALRLDLYCGRESYTAETFKELTKLRLLQLEGVNLTGQFQNLFPQLRLLEWTNHQPDFELTNFHLKKLVVLDLSWSKISENWGGWSRLKIATELKVLNLSNCALRTTPDLSAFKGLEILILEACEDLEEIHPSIEDIETLVSLNVSYCWTLKELPLGVGRMEKLSELLIDETNIREIPISTGCLTKLETLYASSCRWLARLPESLGSLMSLTQLDLENTQIEVLPESIGSLKKLKTLNTSYCALLTCLPNSIGDLASLCRLDLSNCQKLIQLPDSIGSLVSLSQLLLSRCHLLRQIPSSIKKLTSLTELHLKSTAIEELPESIGSLQKLKTLDVSYCASLACIPNSIGDLASLCCLDLSNCQKLAQLPDSIGSLVSLSQLLLSRCRSLRQIPGSIGKLISLTKLHLNYVTIEELPESIGSLQKLKTLNASYCASLACIPNSIGDLASLSCIDLTECYKLAQLPDSIGSLVSLQQLLLSGCYSLRQIPNSIGNLTSLTELHLKSTAIEELPESIGSLKELKILDASYCVSLACIPNSIGNSTSLSCLDLTECHKLAQLPDSIGSLVSLQWLLLSGCHLLRQIPDSIGKLTSLTELHLKSKDIERLPKSIGFFKELKILHGSYYASLAYRPTSIGNSRPNSIGNSTSLCCLVLTECHQIAQLPNFIGSLVSLQRLSLSGCHSLRQIPNSIGKLALLIELHLKSMGIEELPKSIGSLKELKTLDASYCASLTRIPNSIGNLTFLSHLDLTECHKLAQLPNSIGSLVSLQWLLLSGCHSLRQIPDSIGKLTSLIELHLKYTAIEELPKSIGSLKELKTLDVSYCASLACIPNSIGNSISLSRLDLTGCYKLAQLPDSIGSLVSLQWLLLSRCHLLRQIPDSIGKLTSLTEQHLKSMGIEELPKSIASLKELKTLDASYCASLARIPNSIGNSTSLSRLDLTECHKLTQLPNSIGSLVSLQWLLLSGCYSLRQIPDSIGKLTLLIELHLKSTGIEKLPESIGSLKELKTLDASYCALLACIPNSIGNSTSLSRLDLTECHKLAQLPDSIGSLVSLQWLLLSGCHSLRQIPDLTEKLTLLTELHLKSTAIEELPESIGSLKELKTLDASYCKLLADIPSSIGNLTSLSRLDLTECYELAQLPDSIGSLMSLQLLLLSGCHSLRQIPDSIGKLTSLIELHLKSTAIEELPESIGSLKELKTLDASYCKSLANIPSSIGNLTSLSCLDLTECYELAQLPDSIGSLVSLSQLLLSGCHSLRQIPDSIGKLTSLTELHLKSTAIEELPESIGNMQNLRMLDISGTRVIELLNDLGILAELQEFTVTGWKNLEGSPSNNDQLVSPNNLALDKLQKLSELRSRILALVLLKRPKTPTANNSAMDFEHVLKRSRLFGISEEDSESMADVKPRIADDSGDKSQNWKLTEINEPLQCQSIRLRDDSTATRVSRLIYTNSGIAILALSSNAVHKIWSWRSYRNLTGRATTSVVPQLWQPASRILMTNDLSDTNPEDAVPCFALSKGDSYVISASGGKISFFNMMTFKIMTTFPPSPPLDNDGIVIEMEDSTIQIYSGQVDETKLKRRQRIIKGFAFSTSLHVLMSSGADSQTMTTFTPPPPRPTFLAFYPQDNNIIAIGMEDSSIHIYYVQVNKFKANLKGHQKRITGLAFSNVLNVLVSSGADSQLCVWSTNGWEKQASKFLQMPTGQGAAPFADTRVQFHVDQIHLLVVHETQISTRKAPELECLKQWHTREASAPITDATYSCNSQSIYVSFEDGSISVLSASTLKLRCRINPAAYIPPNPNLRVYPLVIAAHPSQPNQFALGLTDGSIYVLEPLESEGEWAGSPSVENGVEPSTASGATSSDQPQSSLFARSSPLLNATAARPQRHYRSNSA